MSILNDGRYKTYSTNDAYRYSNTLSQAMKDFKSISKLNDTNDIVFIYDKEKDLYYIDGKWCHLLTD